MAHSTVRLRVAQPATYRIKIQGALDESWADYFGGLQINQIPLADQASLTVLTGQVLDQVMLLGILNRLCDLGLPIRSVEWLVEQ
ncbi:MAG: hypothetical protein R3C14_15530 [Caldilineaceae bacterium]